MGRLAISTLFLIAISASFIATARSKRFGNICAKPCRFCQPPRECPYGKDRDYCGCCTTCLKDTGEQCGGKYGQLGKCRDGLYCDRSSSGNANGVCRATQIACFVPCHIQPCGEKPTCKYGVGKDICGCCDVCLPGEGEICGGEPGSLRCGIGFYCDFTRIQTGNQNQGICKKRYPFRASNSRRRFPKSPRRRFIPRHF